MIILIALVALLSVVAVHDLIRKPGIRRVALRNLSRRVGEASLVVFGSALGTAIIAGALIVGDTFDNSIRDIARTDLGPIDTLAVVDAPDVDAGVEAVIGDTPIEGVDGVAGLARFQAAIATDADEASRLANPRVRITSADFDELRSLGDASNGLTEAGSTPTGDELVLTSQIADDLNVVAGDRVEVFAYGSSFGFEVRDVVDHIGVAGYGEVFIDPARFATMVDSNSELAAPPDGRVLVSHDGGVFDSTLDVATNDAIFTEVEERLTDAGLTFEHFGVKADLLEDGLF